jgi:membrane fusion protein, multidrug efflux system
VEKSAVYRLQLFGYLALALGVALFSMGCTDKRTGSSPPPSAMNQPVPVVVAEATQRNVPVQVTAIGNVQAYSTVTIESLVDGEIQRAYFTQGEYVRKGELLFTIDPRPFQAALHQAEANLARDEAQAKYARVQAGQYTQLQKEGIVSLTQYQQFTSNADAQEAAVRADQAAVENAKVQLSYCSIYAPISGRTGGLLVYPGNLVKNNSTSLVVINQISPIYVDFSVPEQYLAPVRAYQSHRRLRVFAAPSGQENDPSTGALSFINNTVDSSTGTIELKGTFANGDRCLWPGQFVNVTLDLSLQSHATVVPTQAVQTGQEGSYIYVVKPNLTAEIRPVKVGHTVGGVTVIEQGIKPGETVVTNGQLRLYPGAKVSVKKASASAQESAS